MKIENNLLLSAKNIVKEFPGVKALKGVDIEIFSGQVHALVGENGAGKSTLIKILSGLYQPTSGEIAVEKKNVKFKGPSDSQNAGISVISQEFQLVPQLSIVENIFLGREPRGRLGQIDWAEAKRKANHILEKLGMKISVNQSVEFLSIADQQLIEIAKVLSEDAKVIIMDEPTASLNAGEVERLLKIVNELKKDGKAILYVSHRLDEIFTLADTITVFRDGAHIMTKPTSEFTENTLVEAMIGRPVTSSQSFQSINLENTTESSPLFKVENLSVPGVVHSVSFSVKRGEVLGIAGLIGSGRRELIRALFGLENKSSGKVFLNGKEVNAKTPTEALNQNIYMLTEDRKAEGIVPHFNVIDNMVLSTKNRSILNGLLIDRKEENGIYSKMKEFFNIKTYSSSQGITTLSGGNQQKVLLGRALAAECNILLLNEPTRGVDVGAKVEIYKAIRKVADEGVTVIVSSSEAKELVQLADRCLVLNSGYLVDEISKENLDEDNIVATSLRKGQKEVITQ